MEKWKTGLLIFCVGLLAFLEGNAFSGRERSRQVQSSTEAGGTDADREALKVAITFDDGPHSVCTPLLLDGLKERGVPASFFLLGQCIEGREGIVKRMQEEGHLIGNHTYSHKDLTSLRREEAEREVLRTSNAIYEVTGVYTAFVRPPYGRWPEELEFHVTMVPVLWTLDSRDWEIKDASAVAEEVLSQAESGSVILLHDCYKSSVEAAFQIIDGLTERGYEFVTVDELIFP